MQISVVLTTHNRPDLLVESVRSVVSQSWPKWELIIVDDGSDPPVTLETAGITGLPGRVRIVRHAEPRGLSAARNAGVEAARHEFVTFVDDDDLLAAGALQRVADALAQSAAIDCLFLNVEPFGPLAEGTKANQEATMARILDELGARARTGLWFIEDPRAFFVALLKGLPMAFQRPVVKTATLRSRIGGYSGQAFGDIEFNYRLSLRCRCAILLDPVYRVRCQGQSFFSRTDAQAAMLDAVITIRQGLSRLPEVERDRNLAREVGRSLSAAYFEKAYMAFTRGSPFPWWDFARSLRGGAGWRHVSLVLKVLMRSPTRSNE